MNEYEEAKYVLRNTAWLGTDNGAKVFEAIKIATKALDKQIPVKPSSYKGVVLECPECEEPVGRNVDRYCPWCGQAIDWSEE